MLSFVGKARDRVVNGKFTAAQNLGRASLIVSLCGFIIGALVLMIVLAAVYSRPRYQSICNCQDFYGVYANRPCGDCYYN